MSEKQLNFTWLFIVAIALSCSTLSAADKDLDYANQMRLEDSLNDLKKGDLAFFFDRISYGYDGWKFKFSANTRGMLWTISTGKHETSGPCKSGDVFILPPGASLRVGAKDTQLYLGARGVAGFDGRLRIGEESREGIIAANHTGYRLMYARD